MRILLTTHQFFPQFTAGTEVLTLSVARELLKRGHEVNILTGYPSKVCLADENRFDEYDFEKIHIYRFHHTYAAMGGQVSKLAIDYDNRLAADYFDRIVKSFKPDLVHFFHLNRLGTRLIECAVKAGIPCYMTPTDFWAICPMGQLLLGDTSLCDGPSIHAGNCLKHFAKNMQMGLISKAVELLPTTWADRLVRLTQNGVLPNYPKRVEVVALANRLPVNVARLNDLNAIIAPNEFMRELLVRHGVGAELITVAAFGVDVVSPEVSDQRSEHRRPLRIGFIGTLAPHKGCHVLIEAFKTLPTGAALLSIYGRLDDFPEYTQKLISLAGNCQSITFRGTFPNSKIAQVFADIDVLVIPSLWYENTPLVLYSAQAARCPVIVSNLPGLTEVIEDNENGLLFEPGAYSNLASQLTRILNEDGLLTQLKSRSRAPKPIEKYVDDLMSLWLQP